MSMVQQVSTLWTLLPASIPSPPQGVWWIGPIPLRAYGILIVTGMIVATWIARRRYIARGGEGDVVLDVALWAIPFGLVGARLYHVLTTPSFFGPDTSPFAIFQVWNGGMAIWGGIGFGVIGAVIGVRRAGQRVGPVADSVGPAILVAQAIGRWGNYFNQELFGGPTTLPWGLEIDANHLPAGYPEGTLFHPTFLYEGIWNLTMAALIIWIDRLVRFKSGQVMALYLVAYGTGRFLMEFVRIDAAREYLGLRLNAWTALGVVLVGLVVFLVAGRVNASTRVTDKEAKTYRDRHPAERGN